MDILNKHARILLGTCLLALAWAIPASAADTEIFDASEAKNFVFILDTSGSMANGACTELKRDADGKLIKDSNGKAECKTFSSTPKIDELKSAFRKILYFKNEDGTTDTSKVNAALAKNNIAIMRLNDGTGGRFILKQTYIEDIDDANDVWCIINGCTGQASLLASAGSTPLSETLYEATRYFRGQSPVWATGSNANVSGVVSGGNYITPLSAQCRSDSHIVLMTDGIPNEDGDSDTAIQSLTGNANCSVSYSITDDAGTRTVTPTNCLDELAYYLRNDDNLIAGAKRNVAVHTIAFDLNIDFAVDMLRSTAARGDGMFQEASSATELADAFSNVINAPKMETSSFVAPALSVSQSNSFSHDKEIYYALFEPTGEPKWKGNLKGYQIVNGAIKDFSDTPINVFDSAGYFVAEAKDKWNSADPPKGDEITSGGAGTMLPLPASRNIYTSSSSVLVTFNSTNISASDLAVAQTAAELGITSTAADLGVATEEEAVVINDAAAAVINNEKRDAIIEWAKGGSTAMRENPLGDSMHSQPAVVNYGGTTGKYVFFATNEGFLHAANASTGAESFAFIPKELLGNLNTFVTSDPDLPLEERPFGIDGNIVAWVNDVDGDGEIEAGDHVYLYFGLRRGGSHYYALNVTNPASPSLLWHISGSSLTGLGQTWSTPIKTKVKIGDTTNTAIDVLVFGGGYDENQDNAVPTVADTVGNAVFVVNATSGALVWKAIGGETAGQTASTLTLTEMNYSIPSDLAVIDLNLDDVADRIYFGDMGGQVFRIDLNSIRSSGGTETYIPFGIRMASLSGVADADKRRFYNAPDVALVKSGIRQYLSINIGSGYRAFPMNKTFNDRFYALRDDNASTPLSDPTAAGYSAPAAITEATLADVTTSAVSFQAIVNNSLNRGWYITLGSTDITSSIRGEKVLAQATSAANVLLFTTYIPAGRPTPGVCSSALGNSKLYMVSLFDGSGVRVDNSDPDSPVTYRSSDLVSPGIAPNPLVFLEANGTSNPLLSTIVGTQTFGGVLCDGANDDPLCIKVNKTFWQQITQ